MTDRAAPRRMSPGASSWLQPASAGQGLAWWAGRRRWGRWGPRRAGGGWCWSSAPPSPYPGNTASGSPASQRARPPWTPAGSGGTGSEVRGHQPTLRFSVEDGEDEDGDNGEYVPPRVLPALPRRRKGGRSGWRPGRRGHRYCWRDGWTDAPPPDHLHTHTHTHIIYIPWYTQYILYILCT